jgi:cobalt/nickel transport system permease protein
MAGAGYSLELWLSGTSNLQTVTLAMLGVHTLIGIGEALITVAALTFILQTRPGLLGEGSAAGSGGRGWALAGVILSLVVVLLSPFASVNPDGLNRVAMDLGFIHSAHSGSGPFAGYTVPFLESAAVSRITAGGIGILRAYVARRRPHHAEIVD